jgi:hypothetical protein
MTPSNDFTRPPSSKLVRGLRLSTTIAVTGLTLAGAVWTVLHARTDLSPIVRAASPFAMRDDDEVMKPRYGPGGLQRPKGYERWMSVGVSLGLSYSNTQAAHDAFHQVFIPHAAYEAFARTGTFPEGTMLALEIRGVGSRALPARSGLFANERTALEVAVKDDGATADGWAYYGFGDGSEAAAQPFPSSACFSCHRQHAATDNVFTQFYPRLRKGA